jgi:filamentous hemagglutinin family protein
MKMENVRKISKKYYLRQIVVCWLACYMFFGIPMVARAAENPAPGALPSYGTQGVDYDVGAGSIGTIVPGLNSLTINSVTNGTVIYIDNHDIGSLGTVTYNQVANTDWALVKINETLGSTFYGDNAATGIAGSLTASGNFILSNSRGVVSAPDSYIHGRNLVLSAMRITDTDFGQFASGAIDDLKFNTQPGDIGSVTINGDVSGDESVYIVAKNITNAGTISSPDGLVVMAAGDSAVIGRPGSDVVVEVAMADPASHVVDNGGDGGTGPGTGAGTIAADGGTVILAAGDIYSTAISGVESLRAEAKRDITLNGAISAGSMTLIADSDGSGGSGGGTMHAKSTLTSTSGDIDISASDDTIDLDDDVTAEVDLILNNDTVAADEITLKAGQNVDIATGKILTAEGTLTIEATAGEIMADTSIIDMDADGETLSLTQWVGYFRRRR